MFQEHMAGPDMTSRFMGKPNVRDYKIQPKRVDVRRVTHAQVPRLRRGIRSDGAEGSL